MKKKMENFLTTCGRKYMNQAKDFSMFEFYDVATGLFIIPKKDVDSDYQLKDTIFDMLAHWNCFNDDGSLDESSQLALTVSTHIEDGEEVDGEWDYVLRIVEKFC